jgi:hypothetical protein
MAAEEHHQDGGRHWHAFVQFQTMYRGRNALVFDIGTRADRVHPNIRSSKGPSLDLLKMYQYLKKGYNTFRPWEGPTSTQRYLTLVQQ